MDYATRRYAFGDATLLVVVDQDTIAAIATPIGTGGVSIIRVSGPLAPDICQRVTHRPFQVGRPQLSACYDGQDEVVDQGVVLCFKGPYSYTGEDVFEFQGHGGRVVTDAVLAAVLSRGARLAEPGEFTYRAFMNDKMDLAQAEAVADLIHAHSQQASRAAMQSLQGVFSQQVSELASRLLALRAHCEAYLDFPEEPIDEEINQQWLVQMNEMVDLLHRLQSQAQQGVLLKDGARLAIAGVPNVGKSTLVNRLSGQDVSIVSDQPGTTRDVIRQEIVLDGLVLELTDTAGLRQADDQVEREGIARAHSAIVGSDCLLWVTTANQLVDRQHWVVEQLRDPDLIIVNKTDIAAPDEPIERYQGIPVVYCSAKLGDGITQLMSAIKQQVGYLPSSQGEFSARRRHLAALSRCQEAIGDGIKEYENTQAPEIMAEFLRSAHGELRCITGGVSSDDLLGEVFSEFCIGK